MTDILRVTQDLDTAFNQLGDTTVFHLFLIFLFEFYFFSTRVSCLYLIQGVAKEGQDSKCPSYQESWVLSAMCENEIWHAIQ